MPCPRRAYGLARPSRSLCHSKRVAARECLSEKRLRLVVEELWGLLGETGAEGGEEDLAAGSKSVSRLATTLLHNVHSIF